MSTKIVVIGDVNGRFSEMFSKLTGLQAKQSFAYAIIAGNLFAPTESSSTSESDELGKLLNGDIQIPLPTYFSLGNRPLPDAVADKLANDAGELCPNLTLLGRKVSIKTSEGHRIVAIGGDRIETTDEPMSHLAATYNDRDVESAKAFKESHFLITSNWPAEILKKSKTPYEGKPPKQVSSLSDLCTTLKPRYHFSTSDNFYEREPFFHTEQGPTAAVTRFISLAPFGNPSKQKWIYAFTFDPDSAPPQTGLTASPFHGEKRRHDEPDHPVPDSYRFSNGAPARHDHPPRRGAKRRHHAPAPTPRSCYFCLSNADCETHMITSIGTHAYLTVAKGPLSTTATFGAALGIPAHLLVIPVVHSPTFAAITAGDRPAAVRAEMHRFREALQTMVAAKSTAGADGRARLGAVTCEIARAGGVHLHWQFLPVPVDLVEGRVVEAGFDAEAENQGFGTLVKDPEEVRGIVGREEGEGEGESEGKGREGEEDYFRAMIWSEATGRKDVVLPLGGIERFDLQFGRRVLAKLLGVEHRAHWRDCPQTRVEEEADAEAFKAAFAEYDFT